MPDIATITVGKGYEKNLAIPQGARFLYVMSITGLDLTGLTARFQIRKGNKTTNVYLDASSYVTVDSVNEQIIIDIPGSATAGQFWARGMYDLVVYNSSNNAISPVRLMQGQAFLDPEVSV